MNQPSGEIRVLHVDADPEFLDQSASALRQASDRIDVETATTAAEGLARFAASDVDCVVAGYDLPDDDGLGFLEDIRDRYPAVPVVMFTGTDAPGVATRAFAAGVDGYLRKAPDSDTHATLAARIEALVEQQRTRRQRERQAAAVERAREGIAVVDADGEYVYVNGAYADLYGYAPEEMIGETLTLVHPDDEVASVREQVLPTVACGGRWHGWTTGRRADGSTFAADWLLFGTDDGDVICVAQDASAEADSRTQLDWFRTLVESLDDPVYVLNEEGCFEYVNEAFVETFGYERAELLGAHTSIVKTPETVEAGESALGRILSSDGPDSIRFEVELQTKSGESIPFEDHMSVLPYEGEYFNGSVGMLRDISEQKRWEAELKRQNRRLEEFASVVSHDLRNPLNVAKGRVELAQQECDSKNLDAVVDAHERMEALIDDLLVLARQGEEVGDQEPVHLGTLAEECFDGVTTGDATLTPAVDRSILADRSRLRQLLENLIRNSVEHGSTSSRTESDDSVEHGSTGSRSQAHGNSVEHGGDDVAITVGALADGFYVEDDGSGIPEDERDGVFDAGYTTADDGTGFGLSIVRQIANAHGWTVRATEGSTGGARFEITGVEFVE